MSCNFRRVEISPPSPLLGQFLYQVLVVDIVTVQKIFCNTENHIDNCLKIANSPRLSVANCKICTNNTFADAEYNYHITVTHFTPSNIPYRIYIPSLWWLAILKFIFWNIGLDATAGRCAIVVRSETENSDMDINDNKSNMKFAMNLNVPTKLDFWLSFWLLWEAHRYSNPLLQFLLPN